MDLTKQGLVIHIFSCAFLAIVTSKYVLKIHPSILEHTSESGGEEITCQVGPDRVEWSEKFIAATLLCKFHFLINNIFC
jgi:hypothetical protein